MPGTITARDGEYTLSVVGLPEDDELYTTVTHVEGAYLVMIDPELGAIGLAQDCAIYRSRTNELGLPIAEVTLPVTITE